MVLSLNTDDRIITPVKTKPFVYFRILLSSCGSGIFILDPDFFSIPDPATGPERKLSQFTKITVF
jgi:hypothetical protein